jgi:8-oxo-dGTP diphosphatase
VRAQVVLLEGDRVLMARHDRAGCIFWVLPGGAVEPNETVEEAAVREVLEETGLEIRLLRLLFVDGPREAPGVKITSPRHTYLGEIIGGTLTSIREPENGGDRGCLDGAEWMPFETNGYDAGTRDTLSLVRKALSAVE